jgi:hypothetical protein
MDGMMDKGVTVGLLIWIGGVTLMMWFSYRRTDALLRGMEKRLDVMLDMLRRPPPGRPY